MNNSNCFCCGSTELIEVMTMPNLPLTGYYMSKDQKDMSHYHFDQSLLICEKCGHGQLENIIDPKYLYNDKYSHRGSLSPIASGGNYFFLNYLLKNISGTSFFLNNAMSQMIMNVNTGNILPTVPIMLIQVSRERGTIELYGGIDSAFSFAVFRFVFR